MELSDRSIERALDTWPVARLAVLDAKRRPRVLPIVFARVAGYLWSPVDGKPKQDSEPARIRHVREHPIVEIVLDAYHADWQLLWWVRIDGLARVVQPPDASDDPDVAPVVRALRQKYPQYATTPVLRDPPTLLAIRPDRVRSWCAGLEADRGLAEGTAPAPSAH